MSSIRFYGAALLASTIIAGNLAAAHAGGFALREQSAYGQGSSFAGVAAGGSPSSAFWNPSIIARYNGMTFEQNATLVLPNSEIDSLSAGALPLALNGGLNDSGDIGLTGIVPAGTGIYQINDRLYVGLVTSAPYGLATDANDNFTGDLYGSTSRVLSVNVAPTIAYRINDAFSVGGSVQVQYFKARLEGAVTDLSGDDIGVGFTLGANFTPMEGTEIGLGFRSAVKHTLEGDATAGINPLALGDVTADVTLPEVVSLGLRQRVSERVTLLGTLEWTNWSRLDNIDIEYANGLVLTEEFNWDDGYFAALGFEYTLSQATSLRFGAAYEWSPVNDDNRGVRIPDADRIWLSAGVSHALTDHFTLHAGYTFITAQDGDITLGGGATAFNGESSGHVHIVSVGLKGSFGGGHTLNPAVYKN